MNSKNEAHENFDPDEINAAKEDNIIDYDDSLSTEIIKDKDDISGTLNYRIATIPICDLLETSIHDEVGSTEYLAPTDDDDMEIADITNVLEIISVQTSVQTEEEETIIDGVVIGPHIKAHTATNMIKREYFFWIILSLSFLVALIIVFLLLLKNPEENTDVGLNDLDPSNSPTTPTFMSSFTIRRDYMKALFIPLSGEDVLDDNSTVQHYLWQNFAFNFPTLVEQSIIEINDTKAITQRYLTAVLILSTIGNFDQVQQPTGRGSFDPLHTCQRYLCDENNSVIGFVQECNERNGIRGGTIAPEIGFLTELTDFAFPGNGLIGTIPKEISRLKKLRRLDLSHNRLTGTIPTELGQMESLELVILGSNFLENSIPTEIGNLKKLFFIDLSNNSLTGSLPKQFDNLKDLEGIQLWNNTLSGSVEFLCDNNFIRTHNSFAKDVKVGGTAFPQKNYTYSGELGITVNCVNNVPEIECSCCLCPD